MKQIFKKMLSIVLALCLSSPMFTSAIATSYYPCYTGSSNSIVTALKSLGIDSSYNNRSKIAEANQISDFRGTATQNTKLLTLLKQGKLVIPGTEEAPADDGRQYAPRYTGSSGSIADALRSVGLDGSYRNRTILAELNGISGYQGRTSENIMLLQLLKDGRLLISGHVTNPDVVSTPSPAQNEGAILNNLNSAPFIKQGPETCKATSLAMALNVMKNTNLFTTKALGNNCCTNIDGWTCEVGDTVYVVTYKRDNYIGSFDEVQNHICDALDNGLPIVVAVHKNGSGTQHHWVVLVGRSGNDYLIVDPAANGSGSMTSQVRTMSSSGYNLGLADYSNGTHYGYICFHKQ